MPRFTFSRKSLLRLAPVLILSAIMTLHTASLSLGAGRGSDFARCIVECGAMFRTCIDGCRDECAEAFPDAPPWSTRRRDCFQACMADCKVIRDECREECSVIKPPPSPDTP